MFAVERVQVGVSGLLGVHEPLLGQTPERCVDRRLRSGSDKARDLASCQRARRPAEDEHDLQVNR